MVATTRDEDKAMLASDEAVSHALTKKHGDDAKILKSLIKKPYFARFILAEEDDRGVERKFEYLLGFVANPDCRIIDWRKSPLARIFYEYQEGDEYSEEVQGVLREGTLVLRNTYVIEDSTLKQFNCSSGNFKKSAI